MQIRSLFSFALLILLTSCSLRSLGPEPADTIFLGGTIVTIDAANPEAEALAVRAGRIVAVGSLADVEAYRGPATDTVDLAGRTLLPGFIEPHTHPVASAVLYDWIDVSGFSNATAEEAWEKLREAGRNAEPGEWILAFGWDPILLGGGEAPTADLLDREVSSTNPVWIMLQSMHSHYFNHKAFEVAGVTAETPNPPGGGYYDKDAEGNLTGLVTESAPLIPFVIKLPKGTLEQNRAQLARMFRRYSGAGITTIGVTGMIGALMPGASTILPELARSENSPLRVRVYGANAVNASIFKDRTSNNDSEVDAYENIGIKFWADGSPYTGSMLMNEPYIDSDLMQRGLGIPPGTRGHAMHEGELLAGLVMGTHIEGIQISIHTQGDAATDITLNAYEKAISALPRKDHRHRIEHLLLITEDQLVRAAGLGVTPSFHVLHLYYYGAALRDSMIGPERAERMLPIGAALRAGHRFSFHTDSPMYPPDPLLTVRTAVTRLNREGEVIGAAEAISVEEALRAVTINAAWQMFMEDDVGSLEVGKVADLVVLSDDPRAVAAEKIHEIEVLGTHVRGRETGGGP